MADETCPKCGAEYEVTTNSAPMRDSDYFDCEDCGHRMAKWNSTSWPVYKKIKSGTKPDA